MELGIPYRKYSHGSFINELRKITDLKFFKVLCYFINLNIYVDKNDLYDVFLQYGYKIEDYGDIDKILAYRLDEYDRQITSYYYLYLDVESKLLLIYTLEDMNEIEKTINNLFYNVQGIYYMPINFTAFYKLTNYLKNLFDDIQCTYFTAVHYPTFKTKGLYRHHIKRTIIYYGEDGFESMNELKNYYGLLPRTIRYNIKNYGSFEVNNEGKFTLRFGSNENNAIDLFFKIINFVIEDILTYKKIIDRSEYKIIPFETDEKVFYIPTSEPWILNFSNYLDDDYLEILINNLNNNNFTLFNESKFVGDSFILSSMIYDETKNNIFSIHIDNKKVIVIPYEENIPETFIKLYELLSDFDPESYLEGL